MSLGAVIPCKRPGCTGKVRFRWIALLPSSPYATLSSRCDVCGHSHWVPWPIAAPAYLATLILAGALPTALYRSGALGSSPWAMLAILGLVALLLPISAAVVGRLACTFSEVR
jgi:hypothetical protein